MSFQSAPGGLKTPRAAAVAGILFSVLLLTSIFLIVQTLRVHPRDPGDWLRVQAWKVALALNLIPFAGIAFLLRKSDRHQTCDRARAFLRLARLT